MSSLPRGPSFREPDELNYANQLRKSMGNLYDAPPKGPQVGLRSRKPWWTCVKSHKEILYKLSINVAVMENA